MFLGQLCHPADNIFNKHWIFISLLGNVFFIRSFQQGIDLAGGS